MNKTQTYTLYLPEDHIDKDDTVIACGLLAGEAMKVVFGYEDNSWMDEPSLARIVTSNRLAQNCHKPLPSRRPSP